MFKRSAVRITSILGVMIAMTVVATSRALAMRPDPDPGVVGRQPKPTPAPATELTLNWPLIIVGAIAVVAVVGLLYSVATRRSRNVQHA